MEGLQLQRLLVDPRTALLHRHGVVELRVERQHVQLHRLAVDLLNAIHHVLNKLRIRGSGWMHAHDHPGLLGLLLVSPFRAHLLAIGIDGVLADLVSRHNRRSDEFEEARRKRLSAGRITDDERRVVQPSQLLWPMVEAIGAARHQRHQQPAAHEQCRWVLVALQSLADILQDGVILEHPLNLLAPLP